MLQCSLAGLVARLVCDAFSGDQSEKSHVVSSTAGGIFVARAARGSEGATDEICEDRGILQSRRRKSGSRAEYGYVPVMLGPCLVSSVCAFIIASP